MRAELVHGQGVVVSRKMVALLMRRAGLAGLPLRRKANRVPAAVTVTDLVKRYFRREGPNQLWVTDITEHPTQQRWRTRIELANAISSTSKGSTTAIDGTPRSAG